MLLVVKFNLVVLIPLFLFFYYPGIFYIAQYNMGLSTRPVWKSENVSPSVEDKLQPRLPLIFIQGEGTIISFPRKRQNIQGVTQS